MTEAGGRFSGRSFHKNRAGGVTSSHVSGFRGPNRGAVRGRTVSGDGQGNMVAGSAGAFNGYGSRSGIRASETIRTNDGNVRHNGGLAVSGEMGAVQSSGAFVKNSDGTVSGARNTAVVSQNGGSYQGKTNYSSQTGITHSGTCTDASGNVVACPSR